MLLQFPDLETLTLAITSGLIPEQTAASPATAARASTGHIWVSPQRSLPRASTSDLKRLGITSRRSRKAIGGEMQDYSCWLELIPVQREQDVRLPSDSTPVLFELSDERDLAPLVNEIMRQGNDRMSLRFLEDGDGTGVLLRVIGPPYYSMLRALEAGDRLVARAFVEAAPRVWIELGHQHPLAARIKPSAGQHLLIGGSEAWRAIAEKPFRDVYEHLDFELPKLAESMADVDNDKRLTVPVRLARGGAEEAATLFVLTNNAIAQLDQFVGASSDAILERLAFVVGETSDNSQQPTVVIRIRPGRTAPPVVVFDALACRSFLNISNLFVPVGRRIHPPLRRDAVQAMLASDDSKVVWLQPEESNGNRTTHPFVPHWVNDDDFRPLSEWVDYVIERDAVTIATWQSSHQFDFEDFVCADESTKKVKPPPRRPRDSSPEPTFVDPVDDHQVPNVEKKTRVVPEFRSRPTTDAETARLESELRTLEAEFLATEGPLDAPQRQPLWNKMAELEFALERFNNASLLSQHAIWELDDPPQQTLLNWLHSLEQQARRAKTPSLIDAPGQKTQTILDRHLLQLLRSENPSPAQVSQLCGLLAWASCSDVDATPIQSRTPQIQEFLQRYESLASLRAVWLGWSALASLSDDLLMLARARDRMLQSLFQQGMMADRDVPAFLRMDGSRAGEQLRTVTGLVNRLSDQVRTWSRANLRFASEKTLGYIDLIFAYAYARLGEATRCHELLQAADASLREQPDPVHGWLLAAYGYRIQKASSGAPHTGPLPDRLLEKLPDMDRIDRYKVDRLRQHSRILEPHEELDPYRSWRGPSESGLELSELFDIISEEKLKKRLNALFNRSMNDEARARLVATALELSPRIDERFAVSVLDMVAATESQLSDTLLQANLLEKGLSIAAHYDQESFVRTFLDRLHQLIQRQSHADVATLEALDSLLFQSFQGLRKLGMRDETAQLLNRMTAIVRADDEVILPEKMRVLMQLAGAWYYFGDERGRADIDQVRKTLLSNTLLAEGHVGAKKQTDLAIAYIRAVGQAPLQEAGERLFELFESLAGIHDSATVNSHYSLKQLDIVEALVQTIVSEGFAMNPENQRWLDEEEYLIRRRIHRDVRVMMQAAGAEGDHR